MDKLSVKPEYIKMLTDIFDNYCPEAEIWAYGSRIKAQSHDGSDLDLVVKDFHNNKKSSFELKEIISESNIPFIVDINEFDKLPSSFQDEIKKEYIIIYGN